MKLLENVQPVRITLTGVLWNFMQKGENYVSGTVGAFAGEPRADPTLGAVQVGCVKPCQFYLGISCYADRGL